MRIRWSPVEVMDAADELEAHVEKIIKPLKKAQAAAEKAKGIPNLPQYVEQRFSAFLFEIERVVGGVRTGYKWENGGHTNYQYTSQGTLQLRIADIRKDVPEDALKEARSKPELLKLGVK